MSDTRNHTTRDVLLAALMDEYGGTEQDWTAMRSLHRVATQVRAAAVAETTAAIEALLRQVEDDARENQHLARLSTREVRAALSGGRTALDTAKAEAWDFGYACGLGDYGKSDDETQAANPYRADTGADQ